jgi:hypothetical protein
MARPKNIHHNPNTGLLVVPGYANTSSLSTTVGMSKTQKALTIPRSRERGPIDTGIVDRLATRVLGPAHSTGTAPLTGDGTQKTYSATFVNESGAAITLMSVVLQGWSISTTGTNAAGNTFDVTGNVEYPVGGTTTAITIDGLSTVTVPDGSHIKTDRVVPATTIPAGASFKVNLFSTIPNGLKYIANLGFAGLLTTAHKSLLKKEAIFAIGDSIMTNNGGALYTVTSGRCPCYQISISGTTAQTYGASGAANFTRQVALAAAMGITRFVSNFGTNDFGAMTTVDNLKTYLVAMKTLANASKILFTQTTMIPRVTKLANITATSVTSAGNIMTVVVPDATKFVVGKSYLTAGATQTEYNQVMVCRTIDTQTNTLTFLFPGSGTTPATGTITLTSQKYVNTIEFQTAFSSKFTFGSGSDRAIFNAWVRAGGLDDYMEWADAFEPARDSGRFIVGGETPLVNDVQTCAVVTGTPLTNTRFQTNYTVGTSTTANGGAQFITGANIGGYRTANGNTAGDYTSSSAFANIPTVGDTLYIIPGTCSLSDDGTHPRVASGGKGGQAVLEEAATTKLLTWL